MLAKIVRRGPIAGRVMFLASSYLFAQVITILSLPIISRLFDPRELGLAALVMVFLNGAIPIICLRYDSALPLAYRPREAARIVLLCLLAALALCSGLYVTFLIMQNYGLLGFDALPQWTHWVILVSLPGTAFFAIGQAWWLRRHRTAYIGRQMIARAAAHNGTRIGAGFLGLGVPGLMIAEAAMALVSLWMIIKMPWLRIIRAAWPFSLYKVARHWRRFPLIEWPSTLIDTVNVSLPIPIVAMLYGPGPAGLFAIALRIGSIPVGQVGAAVANATYMEFSRAERRSDRSAMQALFGRMTRLLLLFGFPIMVALAVGGPLLAGPILGKEWESAGVILTLMAPWLCAQFVVVPSSRILSVLQKQSSKLIVDFTFLLSMILSFLLAKWLALDLFGYVALLSGLMTLSYIGYFVVIRTVLRSSIRQVAATTI